MVGNLYQPWQISAIELKQPTKWLKGKGGYPERKVKTDNVDVSLEL